MTDRFGRKIDYLRISITDRCNLRCKYCMPEGVDLVEHRDLLRYEELLSVARAAVSLGITHFKVTGGEPLVRRGCLAFLKELKALPGVETVSLTTNGVLLAPLAKDLAEVGIDGVNVSLDTTDPVECAHITGSDCLPEVLAGIGACLEAGINEIYIVRGYLAEQFDQLLYKYPMVKFLDNAVYNEANNISSSMAARHLLSNAYVLEADLVISNPKIITKYHYRSDFLAIPKDRTDDWCFTVKDGIITEEKVGGLNCWQMVGISYWDEEDGRKLAADIEHTYAQPGGKERYWEQVPLVFHKDHYQVEVRPCRDEDIIEIDTFRELKAIDKTYDV